MGERRRAPRVNVNLPARWEGALSQLQAEVTSLSINGCFVLTGGKVELKELIRLEIIFPDDQVISLWSEVVDEAEDIGFAVRFTFTSDEEHERLDQFIKRTLEKS